MTAYRACLARSVVEHYLHTVECAPNTTTPAKLPPRFSPRLTDEQLDALRACAKGISLRFEKSEVVNALLASGCVSKNVAGVTKVTTKGLDYLRRHGL
jgi:hypothetical protein